MREHLRVHHHVLYNIWRTQDHTAQLNRIILRQQTRSAPRWVARTSFAIAGE